MYNIHMTIVYLTVLLSNVQVNIEKENINQWILHITIQVYYVIHVIIITVTTAINGNSLHIDVVLIMNYKPAGIIFLNKLYIFIWLLQNVSVCVDVQFNASLVALLISTTNPMVTKIVDIPLLIVNHTIHTSMGISIEDNKEWEATVSLQYDSELIVHSKTIFLSELD